MRPCKCWKTVPDTDLRLLGNPAFAKFHSLINADSNSIPFDRLGHLDLDDAFNDTMQGELFSQGYRLLPFPVSQTAAVGFVTARIP